MQMNLELNYLHTASNRVLIILFYSNCKLIQKLNQPFALSLSLMGFFGLQSTRIKPGKLNPRHKNPQITKLNQMYITAVRHITKRLRQLTQVGQMRQPLNTRSFNFYSKQKNYIFTLSPKRTVRFSKSESGIRPYLCRCGKQ